MHKLLLTLAIIAAAFVVTSHAPAQAQLNHTWVSSGGSNAANCDRATPCAIFDIAYQKTNAGGEITCVDSGNYAGMSISKSITVNCEAAIGSATFGGGVSVGGIAITNLLATDVVILRGLDVDGASIGGGGGLITFDTKGTLRLEKMKISSFHGPSSGIQFNPSGTAKLHVSDSIIANNGTSGINAGIFIKPASGVQATVEIERTVVSNNQFGIFADGTGGGLIRGVVKDSVVSGNTLNGISINTSGANVGLTVDNTLVSGNNIGLAVGGAGGLMLVRHSTITANNTGLSTGAGGTLVTYRDNLLNNNTADGAFSFALGTQ